MAGFCQTCEKLKPDDRITFVEAGRGRNKGRSGEIELQFDRSGKDLLAALADFEEMPLPPYIERERRDAGGCGRLPDDLRGPRRSGRGSNSRTTFHRRSSGTLAGAGIKRAEITLHVGAGTFLPVKAEDTDDHRMHSEWYDVSVETADLIRQTRLSGGRVVAIGTTSLRTLEAAASDDGTVPAGSAETDLFITPGYRFKAVDVLLTNFLPRSTLLMLVSAFAGRDSILEAYEHAIQSKYRFYSYGDACLLKAEL